MLTIKNAVLESFQDVDGGFSSKRVAFCLFVLLFIFMAVIPYFRDISPETMHFARDTLDKVQVLIQWLGTLIVAERAPQALASMRGGQTADVSPANNRE